MKRDWFVRGLMLLALLLSLSSGPAAPTFAQSGSGGRSIFLPLISQPGASSAPVIIPPTTKPLSAQTMAGLTSVSPDGSTYTFNASVPGAAAFQPGNVLLSGVTPKTPTGLMRRVTKVTQSGQSIVVQTAPASLIDAVTKGSLHVTKTLSAADIVSQSLAPGVTMARVSSASSDGSVTLPFTYNISGTVIYDKDGNPATTYDQVRIDSGNITVTPTLTVDAAWDSDLSPDIKATLQTAEKVDLNFGAKVSNDFNKDTTPVRKDVLTAQLATFDVPISATPPIIITVTPILHLYVGIDGKVEVGVQSHVSESASVTGCGHFANWGLTNCPAGFDQPPTLKADPPQVVAGTMVKVYGGAGAEALIEGMASVMIGGNVYLRLETDAVSAVKWKLFLGYEIPVMFHITVITWHVLPEYAITFPVSEKVMLQYNAPPGAPSAPSPPDGAANQPTHLTLAWKPGGDPNGDPVTYTVTLDTANPPAKVVTSGQPGASYAASGLQPGATYYWQVTATDSHGAATTGPVWRFTTAALPPPLAVTPVVRANGYFSCALSASGDVMCWGENYGGQIGNGTVSSEVLTPTQVIGLTSGVQDIALGWTHACALVSGGLDCWGLNDEGQLGDGTITNHASPVAVQGLGGGVKAVAGGGAHTCALTSAGGVKCWGWNAYGQLGSGTTTDSHVPVDVVGLTSGVKAIAAGADHTCAVTDAGAVKCWGFNAKGQLGNGTNANDSSVPVNVIGLSSGVTMIAAGLSHTCALVGTGDLKCWGDNSGGQLGLGAGAPPLVSSPTDVVGLRPGVISIALGSDFSCAVSGDGVAQCWGMNAFGQLGNGTNTPSLTPVGVRGQFVDVLEISAGVSHACAETAQGVFCWGRNISGEVGDGTTTPRSSAVPVVGLP